MSAQDDYEKVRANHNAEIAAWVARGDRLEARVRELEVRIAFYEAAVDAPFTETGQDSLKRRLSGLAKAVNEEMEPGSRAFCLAAVEEFALAYRSLRHDHDIALARAEAAEREIERLREALGKIEAERTRPCVDTVGGRARCIEIARAALAETEIDSES